MDMFLLYHTSLSWIHFDDEQNRYQIQITSRRSLLYSRKSVGPRMEPLVTPPLTGYFCKDFPSRITWSWLLLRKWRKKTKYLSWNSISLWRRPVCHTLSKALDVSSAILTNLGVTGILCIFRLVWKGKMSLVASRNFCKNC